MSEVVSFSTLERYTCCDSKVQVSKTVSLNKSYVAPPKIVTGICGLEVGKDHNLRVKAYTDNVDTKSFTSHIDTWSDTAFYSGTTNHLVLKPGNLDYQTGEWCICEGPNFRHGAGAVNSRRINFERPFATPPKVITFLKYLDMGSRSDTATRVKIYPTEIDAKGFTLHVDSWMESTVFGVIAAWVAYPEDKDNVYSGTAYIRDTRPGTSYGLKNHGEIKFPKATFYEAPTVFVGINWIDSMSTANVRFKAYVDNVTAKGMTWHVDSPEDTKTYDVGLTYLAFN
ncbi:hypothetical protein FRB90_008140 [Tulasnella sp. 427]|nr:hypothetical protein FRB90_008140 [Tulasnella sp. 427]